MSEPEEIEEPVVVGGKLVPGVLEEILDNDPLGVLGDDS